MPEDALDRKNMLAMKLLHYFITEKNYNPIILQGAEDEIWLENLDSEYKVIRIVQNHIHNEEQFDFDIFKAKHILKKIKRKTFSFNMNVLSIFTDVDEEVKVDDLDEKNIDCVYIFGEEDLKKYKFVYDIFPDIDKKLEFSEDGFQLFMKITSDINKKNREDAVKVDKVFGQKKPIITFTFMLINVMIFFLTYVAGYYDYVIDHFAINSTAIIDNHEFYRIITGMFIQGGILHFIVNLYSLFMIGNQVENYMGRVKFILVYLFSGICGSLLSMAICPGVNICGASACASGMIGSLIYFGYHYRVYLGSVLRTQIIPCSVLTILASIFTKMSDVVGILGAGVGAFFISSALGVKYRSSKSEIINGIIVSVIYVGLLIILGFKYINF